MYILYYFLFILEIKYNMIYPIGYANLEYHIPLEIISFLIGYDILKYIYPLLSIKHDLKVVKLCLKLTHQC